MNKAALVEAAVRKTAEAGSRLPPDEVERVIDALFGTVEYAGAIAEGLKRGETVTVIGFGDFHLDDAGPVLRPGHALHEYIKGSVS
ncbi:HU family DNA-binding protein [Streptomyces sp. NPDC058637]|uniref:HU family DNA-binding protein n=1 Tax=Streptomyces sp. NPDC058637 TaxID=3346569 RepID=UPI0036565817